MTCADHPKTRQQTVSTSKPPTHKIGQHVTHSACNAVERYTKSRMHTTCCTQPAPQHTHAWSDAWLQTVPYIPSNHRRIHHRMFSVGHTTQFAITVPAHPSRQPLAPYNPSPTRRLPATELCRQQGSPESLSPLQRSHTVSCCSQPRQFRETAYWLRPLPKLCVASATTNAAPDSCPGAPPKKPLPAVAAY